MERAMIEMVPHDNRKDFKNKIKTCFSEEHSFIIFDSDPSRRLYWKMRFRQGFDKLVFPIEENEMNPERIKNKRKSDYLTKPEEELKKQCEKQKTEGDAERKKEKHRKNKLPDTY